MSNLSAKIRRLNKRVFLKKKIKMKKKKKE